MNHRLTHILLAVASVGSLHSFASAQCSDWIDQPTLRRAAAVRASTTWDPDGAGPQQPWLVVAGDIDRADGAPASNIAAWDGQAWRSLANGITLTHALGVRALTSYNGVLIAAGSFAFAGQESAFNIARWDGESWRPMGDIFGDSANTEVLALAEYNGDLIAAGHFSEAGGTNTRNIARWNGFQWQPLDGGINGQVPSQAEVNALVVYNGQLYAGGHFDVASGVACQNIARWNGSNWQPVSGGIGLGNATDWVIALAVHKNELIVGGYFTGIGGTTACNNIAAWNGSAWRGLGVGECGLNDYVFSLASFEGSLFAGGRFTEANAAPAQNVARWDGLNWHALAEGIDGFVDTFTVYNNELVAGGAFLHAGSVDAESVARWDGKDWRPTVGVTVEPAGRIDVMTPWAGRLIIGGSHGTEAPFGSPRSYVSLLSAWDGVQMSSIGNPNGTVRAMTTRTRLNHSSDLIIAGDFTEINGVDFNHIAIRNDTIGGLWQPLGQGLNGTVYAVEMHNGSIYAGGSFTISGSAAVNNVARWNGTTWEGLAAGVNGNVYALKSFNGELYVGGSFSNASGISAPGLAHWNGTNWLSVSQQAFVGAVYDLDVFDGALVIAGEFPGFGGCRNVAWFNGFTAGTFGSGANNAVISIGVKDNAILFGGYFNAVNGAPSDHVARWVGELSPVQQGAWSTMPGATDGPVRAIAAFADEIHVAGEFRDVRFNSLYSPLWARFSDTGVPWVARQPVTTDADCAAEATFSVAVASGYDNLQYQWRKDDAVLTAGATSHGSMIVLDGPTLRILNVNQADAGSYTCSVSGDCGSSLSQPATLTINGDCHICTADFNDDGVVNSQDFFDFVTAFFALNPNADFNNNGVVNSQDFFDFLAAFFVGC